MHNQPCISIKTQKLAKDVYLTADSENNFSDNYFDMLPNTEKKVTIRKSQLENLESFIEKLKVITLFDSYIN
jgi:beta-mannosidase